MTVIYYEYEPVLGVNCQYHDGTQFVFDYFSSIQLFNIWVQYEMAGSESVEITNDNYEQLKMEGHISG